MSEAKAISRPTLVAIAVVAYALANLAHEGLGHGGACLLAGGSPLTLSAVHFEEEPGSLEGSALKWVSAGGTIANVAVGALALFVLRATRGATSMRYFLWLLATVNLLQAAGYWLFSGVGNVGDWAAVIEGWAPHGAFRFGLAIVGLTAYVGVVVLALRELRQFLGSGPGRLQRALTLTLVPYLTGGLLYVAAGLLNPMGFRLVLISAAAASFGGTSALAWMAQLLRDERRFPTLQREAPGLPSSASWLAAGALVALLFVLVLGPGVRL